jgi:anti-sigma factor RsiW
MKHDTGKSTLPCDQIQLLLALGEPIADPTLREHFAACATCAAAAQELEQLSSGLAAAAEIEPPAHLDRRVREHLRDAPLPGWLGLRPGLATGLAAASFVALVAAAAVFFAQAGAAEMGPALAVVGVSIYMAFSFAATLPLLFHERMRQWRRRTEVNG